MTGVVMTIEEVNSFIVEMSAIRKMAHYLPLDLLTTHIEEMAIEIKTIRDMSISEEEKKELIERIQNIKDSLGNEIHKR